MNRLTKICIAVAVVAAVLWISSMDYSHEVSISKEYQYNVCNGYWPDFKNLNPDCKEYR